MHRTRSIGLAGLAALALMTGLSAPAQSWPERPMRVVVPLPPGGPSDIVLRSAAPKVQQLLGQPLVIDNKPGANGNIGTAEAARASGDGYIWLWTTDTTLTVNPHVYEKMPFKAGDLQAVMRASSFSQTLVCHPKTGLKSVADLVRKAKSGPMTYASGGPGSPGHLSTELFSSVAGIQMTHVPYKGPAPAVQDMLGGQVDCGFLAGPTVLPHVRAGRLVALAVSGAADMVSVVIRQTLMQLDTPDEIRGRVGAINTIFIGASNQLGEFESGVTAALVGLHSRTAEEDAQAGRQAGEGRDILLHSTAWQRLHAKPNRKGLA